MADAEEVTVPLIYNGKKVGLAKVKILDGAGMEIDALIKKRSKIYPRVAAGEPWDAIGIMGDEGQLVEVLYSPIAAVIEGQLETKNVWDGQVEDVSINEEDTEEKN